MPRSFWRSADAVAQLNQLERAGFALEFFAAILRTVTITPARSGASRAAASIPTKRALTLHGDGGCVFAYDPDIPTRHNAVLWRPEAFPGALRLTRRRPPSPRRHFLRRQSARFTTTGPTPKVARS